jgi:hypothetical protein
MKLRLRNFWFTLHKWIGLLLALLIVPVSLSGAALVWYDKLDEALNPERSVSHGAAQLAFQTYVDSARTRLGPGDRVQSLAFPEDEGAVRLTAVRPPAAGGGRPLRTLVWIDPASAEVLDVQFGNEGAVRFLHVLHGSLMIPGRGAAGRRLDRSLHARLVADGTVALVAGARRPSPRPQVAPPAEDQRQSPPHDRLLDRVAARDAIADRRLDIVPGRLRRRRLSACRRKGAAERAAASDRASRLDPEVAGALAVTKGEGAIRSIAWPTTHEAQWAVTVRAPGLRPVDYKVEDSNGEATAQPLRRETPARAMRRWHDGDGMGIVWQVVIFLGGIAPALLAATGIMMWLRSKGWRAGKARMA